MCACACVIRNSKTNQNSVSVSETQKKIEKEAGGADPFHSAGVSTPERPHCGGFTPRRFILSSLPSATRDVNELIRSVGIGGLLSDQQTYDMSFLRRLIERLTSCVSAPPAAEPRAPPTWPLQQTQGLEFVVTRGDPSTMPPAGFTRSDSMPTRTAACVARDERAARRAARR